jgi:hypothetical protein
LHIGIRTQSEVFVSLKLMILNLLVVELNAGWVHQSKGRMDRKKKKNLKKR